MICKDKGIEGMSGSACAAAGGRPARVAAPVPAAPPRADLTDLRGVAAALTRGDRVILIMRHAERPHLSLEDPTFGAELPITKAGADNATELGRFLAPFRNAVQFRSSPLRRCRLTAQAVADGMGVKPAVITDDPQLGDQTPFFDTPRGAFETIRDRGFWAPMMEYYGTGSCAGFAPIGPAADALERHLLPLFTARLGIFTSHDSQIAAFLTARRAGVPFCRANWISFLGAAAIFIAADGSRRYAYCAPRWA